MIDLQAPKQNKTFQAGDTVRLNSGSPDLKVVSIIGDGRVSVAWQSDGDTKTLTAARECFHLVA